MKQRVEFAIKTDRGLVRAKNEDSYFAYFAPENWPCAFAVADGMGGHSGGEVASKIATDYCKDRLARDLSGQDQADRTEMLLSDTIQKANVQVYLQSLEKQGTSGMGTTLTLAVLYPESLYLAHVGDSRCYIMRKGILEKISRDHTLVQEMQDAGTLTAEEGASHPQRHILTQALGVPEYLKPEILRLEIKKNDRYLLCSDGLHGYLSDQVIEETLRKAKSAEACVNDFVELALASGGYDNVTAIAIFI